MASDYEDEYLSDAVCKDDYNDKPCKSGDAISFMGQLTPGSSVSKARSRTPDCPTWTRLVFRIDRLLSACSESILIHYFRQFS